MKLPGQVTWSASYGGSQKPKKGETLLPVRVDSSFNQPAEKFDSFDLLLKLNRPLPADIPEFATFRISGYVSDWKTNKGTNGTNGEALVDVEFESSVAEVKSQERPSAPAQTVPKQWAGCIDVKRLHQLQYHEGGCNFMTVAATSGLPNAQIEVQRRQCYAAHGFSDWEQVQSCFR